MSEIMLDVELVRDYLAGRLSESATRDFESRVARDPALLRSMEEMLRFREGLEVLLERGELEPLLRGSRRWTRWVVPATAAAAVVAVAVMVARTVFAPPPLLALAVTDLRIAANAPHRVVAQYSLAAMRQSGDGPTLDLPTAGPLELRILAPGETDAGYDVRLSRRERTGSMRELARLEGLHPSADGFLSVYADAAGLAPGEYLLAVDPTTGTSAPAEVGFSLRSAPANPAH